MDPHLGAVRCLPGDRFLLCTDGVNDGLWDQRLEEYTRTDGGERSRAALIVERAVEESGRDNCTAVVVELL